MSTNSECYFIEVEPGKWFYLLEDINAPQNAWDWRDHASAFGPFATEDETRQHLDRHHANPGGYSTLAYDPERKPDEVEQKLIAEAEKNKRELDRPPGRFYYGGFYY